MSTEKVNEATRQEWRELGFFYDLDDTKKEWLLRGSRAGLLGFSRILLDYSKKPQNQRLSEHDHLGPYMYLKIGTWNERIIDEHWIAGTVEDLRSLSIRIAEQILKAREGDVFRFREAYSPTSPYELRLEVCGDDFDPAAADSACW